MSIAPYRRALSSRELRIVLTLGIFARLPSFAVPVIVTIHVVTTLHGTYAQAGIVGAVATLATAVSSPWRGRLLDRIGLRRVVAPSAAINLLAWLIAPWTSYPGLLVCVAVAFLFGIPFITIGRQAVIAVVREEDRKTAIALDSAAVEVSYIAAPAIAVAATVRWGTPWVLLCINLLGVLGGVVLWVVNPRITGWGEVAAQGRPAPLRTRFRLPFLGVCLAALSATLVLAGSDLSIVAMVRSFDTQGAIGVVLAFWGLGSLVGGLLYGAMHRSIPAFWLLGALGLVTLPLALATSLTELSALALLAGLLCAPTITATVDQASRVVPPQSRGEAMGWHGSFLTAGGTLGAPLAGLAIDHSAGAGAGFVAVALVGVVVAAGGTLGRFAVRRSSRSIAVPQPSRANLPTA